MNLSKYIVGVGALALTVSACGGSEKIVYVPAPDTEPATTQPYKSSRSGTEQDFLDSVRELYDGVIYADDQLMIDAGYETCRLFRQGYSLDDIIDVLNESADGDSAVYSLLSSVVVAAVFNFCPDQEYRFSDSNV